MNDKIEHLDFSALAELREIMEDEFEILIETYLDDSAERIIEMQEAVKERDANALSHAAHSLKGSCTNIGVPVLAKLCMEAEMKGKAGDLEGVDELLSSIENVFSEVSQLLKAQI